VRTLDELADVAGLSRYHFARRFRDEVGVPPWAYVRSKRAERARRLLESGAPPAEVAHETGYADQPHLTRDLRERFGRTPGEIRRRSAGQNRKDVQDAEALTA
jgi:AraC-like DNA-binding protein